MGKPSRRQLWRWLGIPANYSRANRLPIQREATRLVAIGRNVDGRIIKLSPRSARAWTRMRDAAQEAGVILIPISGFRSVARQTHIIRRKLFAGARIADILRVNAAPGCSEHHTGRALDIGSPEKADLNQDFARTVEYRWLKKHAGKFGFQLSYPRGNSHGIGYEPWHWCWHGSTER